MVDLPTLKDHHELEFKRKEALENKANNMTTVAGVVAALLFGFGQLLIEKLASLHYDWLSSIIAILLFGILSSLVSIVLSVFAFRVQNYYYVIGHTAKPKPSYRGTYGAVDLTRAGDEDAERDAYKTCIDENSKMNDSKARRIEISLWTFVASVTSIAILTSLLLIVPITFPP
jgi:hypothetical protein